MSAAGQAAAAPQTARASELTEGIGDVLASIRRMIAQEAGATPRPALAAVGETGERGGVLRLGPERRYEAGPAAAPEEDRTAPARAMALRWASGAGAYTTAPAAVVPMAPARAAATHGEALPADLAEATMPAAQSEAPRESQATAARLEPLPADSPASGAAEADLTAHAAPLRLAPVSEAAPLAPPPVEAAPLATAGPALAAIVTTTPAAAAVPPVATPAAPPPAPAAAQQPAAPPVAGGEDADFLGSMIRDVLRQELRGDGSGRMGQELRSMILREVARVITRPDA